MQHNLSHGNWCYDEGNIANASRNGSLVAESECSGKTYPNKEQERNNRYRAGFESSTWLQFGAATVAPSVCSVISLCKRVSAPKQEAGVHQTLGAE